MMSSMYCQEHANDEQYVLSGVRNDERSGGIGAHNNHTLGSKVKMVPKWS